MCIRDRVVNLLKRLQQQMGLSYLFITHDLSMAVSYTHLLEGDGHAKLFWGGKQVCHGISKVRNGRIMAAAAKSTVPEFYAVLDATTGELLDIAVQSAQKLLDEVKLSEPEDFFFSTLDGESHVHGFVMMPHDAKKGEKYPAILYIHGGPHPFYTYGSVSYTHLDVYKRQLICCVISLDS